ncbi:MAG: glycosyltransferase family 4 protein [Weeksellaceae bacterium]
MNPKPKLIRVTTVPVSLNILLRGQFEFMSKQGFEVLAVSSSGPDLDEVAEREKVRTEAVEMSRKISPLKDLKSLRQMYRLFQKEKPDIVHSHTPKAGIIAMVAAKLAGVPVRLHTVAGLPLMETSGFRRKLLTAVEKMTYRCATKIYPNSKGLTQFILENRLTAANKLKQIANGSSNGIDTSHFSACTVTEEQKTELRKISGILADDFVFVFVGRLVGDKGINELVAAFSEICASGSNQNHTTAKLILVGDYETELDPLLPETLKEIDSNPNIFSAGYQKDVRPWFGISDCLVFPSYREGFPNVVMQAGAMGLPAVVSNINGCNEIIADGLNGLIVPKKDTAALKKAMLAMMTDRSVYKQLKSNARNQIVSRFEQKEVWEALLEEYLLEIKG